MLFCPGRDQNQQKVALRLPSPIVSCFSSEQIQSLSKPLREAEQARRSQELQKSWEKHGGYAQPNVCVLINLIL